MPKLWQNMNCGQVCCGKSWQGSKTVYCANSQLGGHTQTGGGMEMGCYIFVGDLYNAYVVAKYDLWPSVLLKKLAMHGQRLCNCANSQFYGGGYLYFLRPVLNIKQFQLSVCLECPYL